MTALDGIDTIVYLMLENRSFDHMLGHLSCAPYANGCNADGLKEPFTPFQNFYQGVRYYPFPLRDGQLAGDLPHERNFVATQLAMSDVTGACGMSGFAEAYLCQPQQLNRGFQLDPMGFLTPQDVPITRFLADNFAVCDRWFASLPTSTQPNRCMATSGTSRIDDTTLRLIPPHPDFILDWLEKHHVRWRVYHSGISFFLLFGRDEIFGPNFRSIARLAPDVKGEKDGDFPQVIIIEPAYGDTAAILGGIANDNHPPTPVAAGETLLKTIYDALTVNPARWSRLLWVITYDEHGGFYDHVPPPAIGFKPAANAKYKAAFDSLGVRVPSLVVSPRVRAKQVCSEVMDHTSFLELLAEKFTPGAPYSKAVEQRSQKGKLIRSVSCALKDGVPRTAIPKAPPPPPPVTVAGPMTPPPKSMLQQAFEDAARKAYADNPKSTSQQYPLVAHWALTDGKVVP